MMVKARLSIIAALLAIGLVAGCGGSSSSDTTTSVNDFKKDFVAATAPLKQTTASIGSALKEAPGKTNAQLAATFSDLATEWQSGSAKLNSLSPPPALESEFDAVKGAVAAVESDLKALSTAAGAGNVSAARAASIKLARDVEAAKAAAIKLQGAS